MSLIAPGFSAFQSIYRLVSPTVNVKNASLNANSKFNTNIPFDLAMLIYRVEWGIAVKDPPTAASNDWQITAELTENGAVTTASNTDPLIIHDTFYEERVNQVSAVGEIVTWRHPFSEHEMDFVVKFGGTYPSVAQQFNIVASMVVLTGSGPATAGVDIFCNIWYTLAPVTAALRDYLTKRQQIQR